jgi:hypothetical protein
MRHNTRLLRAAVTASLMLVAIAGAAVAGPMEDGEAARDRKDYATALRFFKHTCGTIYQQRRAGEQRRKIGRC